MDPRNGMSSSQRKRLDSFFLIRFSRIHANKDQRNCRHSAFLAGNRCRIRLCNRHAGIHVALKKLEDFNSQVDSNSHLKSQMLDKKVIRNNRLNSAFLYWAIQYLPLLCFFLRNLGPTNFRINSLNDALNFFPKRRLMNLQVF